MIVLQPWYRGGKSPPTDVILCHDRVSADNTARQLRNDGHQAKVVERTISVGGAKATVFVVAARGEP